MEVFVRNEDIKYAVVDKSDFEPYSFLLESYDKIEVKSIDQHDAEVKKQVVEELREFLLKDLTLYTPHSFEYDNPDLRLFREREKVTNDLEQKLAELITPNKKGEKDE